MQLQITDIRIFEDVPFDTYLTFPGTSFSMAKGTGPINPTEKMRLGSLVHCYLLEPSKYDGTNYKVVKAIAGVVNDHIGGLLKSGKRELTVMCTMIVGRQYLYYKGRVDLFAGNMVIDLKVSEMKAVPAILHFGYNNQLNGYALTLNAMASILFAINPNTLLTSIAPVPNSTDWWAKTVQRLGTFF